MNNAFEQAIQALIDRASQGVAPGAQPNAGAQPSMGAIPQTNATSGFGQNPMASRAMAISNPVYKHLFIDPNAFLAHFGNGGFNSGYDIFQNMPQYGSSAIGAGQGILQNMPQYGASAMGAGQGILQNMPQRPSMQARPQAYGSMSPELQRMQQQEQVMQRMNKLMMERGEYEDAQRQAASFMPTPAGPGSLGGVRDRGGFLQPSDYVPPSAEEIMEARKTGMSPTAVRMTKRFR